MKALFDNVSHQCSKLTTTSYSTSFSFGIRFLDKKFRNPIYAVYGFVRFADEIVDTFHDYDKEALLHRFREDTWMAIEQGISLNPILNSFQEVVNRYQIDRELIETFLNSMEMDLSSQTYDRETYRTYILGSAEVVGLMCLRIFTEGNNEKYQALKPAAMRLGSAFQKVNFLRDLKDDYQELGRCYFPHVDMNVFDNRAKTAIEAEIHDDFREALNGIRQLPKGSKAGVYLAYVYYTRLFQKIRTSPAEKIRNQRIRIPNTLKFSLMLESMVRHRFNMI